ncbi:hypothetical protein FPF85_23735 [Salmonella enterica subsp. enterica]|uniref:Uncharacterized protein n=1 Tax=Salmonella enterica subsp. enterica serovar Glostrup TaxID=1151180 RepID=A0A5I6PW93_SALET|nr:hypothetical protein [Salmonella enterica subsp. enterica serovar Glostrup]EDA5930019.1 hypothetical protein [Salmonella enterica subsp. enterica serovar Kottbus]EEB1923342.1 hypothetical protein [Salmonella enterica subsp. enterica serovar Hvittingfoss]EHW4335481.1 hypothetical protein [Salmonella enterica subsp. enterica serovar Enteritidis]HAK8370191.1 hypothetical protein [Salmonella enterica]
MRKNHSDTAIEREITRTIKSCSHLQHDKVFALCRRASLFDDVREVATDMMNVAEVYQDAQEHDTSRLILAVVNNMLTLWGCSQQLACALAWCSATPLRGAVFNNIVMPQLESILAIAGQVISDSHRDSFEDLVEAFRYCRCSDCFQARISGLEALKTLDGLIHLVGDMRAVIKSILRHQTVGSAHHDS